MDSFEGPKELETSDEMLDFYFANVAPLMKAISHCESGYKQFEDNGSPVKSDTNDWGIMQINATAHDKEARKLGLDYKHNMHDNIKMAKRIYDTQGLTAWTTYKNGCYKAYL